MQSDHEKKSKKTMKKAWIYKFFESLFESLSVAHVAREVNEIEIAGCLFSLLINFRMEYTN